MQRNHTFSLTLLFFLLLWIADFSIVNAKSETITQTEEDSCRIQTLPFKEDFSAAIDLTDFPPCWRRAGSNATIRMGTANSYKTANSVSMATGNILVIAPMLDAAININTLQVRYALNAARIDFIFEVGVMTDTTDATTFEALDRAFIPSTGWREQVAYLSNYTGTGRYIAFKGVNSAGANFLDDITIEEAPECVPVKELRVTNVGTNSLYIDWGAYNCHTNLFEVSYKHISQSSWTSYENTYDPYSLIEGLASGEVYDIQVVANCEAATSTPMVIRQATLCLPVPVDTVGTPTASTNESGRRIPTSIEWITSYSQQIYKAGELNLNGSAIKGFAMQYTHTTDFKRNITVYVGHTNKEAFADNNDYVSLEFMTEVFDGEVDLKNSNPSNWVDFIFHTPFEYDGTANLVIAISDHTGTRNSNNASKFKTHQVSDNITLYCVGSSSVIIDVAQPVVGERTNYRNNTMFYSACQSSFCIAPSIVKVSDITDTEAKLTWVKEGNISSVELEYKTKAETSWTSAGTTAGKTFSLTGLQPNTDYNVRIRGICGEMTPTSEITVDFKTTVDLVACAITMLPYNEDFETYANNEYPPCWNQHTSSYDNLPAIETDGTKVMKFIKTPDAYSVAVLPKIENMLLSDLQISIRSKTTNSSDGFLIVGVMDDPEKANTFEFVDTVKMTTTGWDSYDIPFAEYAGTGKYIALMWNKSKLSECVIDDITIDYATTCPRPAALNIDSVNARQVFFSWKNPKNSLWQAVLLPSGDAPDWDKATVFDQTNGTFDNLKPNSSYTLYVMAVCSDEYSAIAQLSFSTKCGVITEADLPYTESFDKYGIGTSAYPSCWTRYFVSVPSITSATSASAPGSLLFNFMTAYDNLTAITEEFDMDVSTLQASFKLYGNANATALIVGVMTDPNAANTFTPVDTVYLSKASTWEKFTVYFDKYEKIGQPKQYIAFRAVYFNAPTYTIYMDDLLIENMDMCPPPAQVEISNVTDESATITWQAAAHNTRWQIAYGDKGFNVEEEEGIIISTDIIPTTISQLIIDNIYDVYVRTACDDGESAWTLAKTFHTQHERAALPYQHDFENIFENERWVISNGDEINKWYIGATDATPDYSSSALYISNDNGLTNEYNSGDYSAVYAKRYFIFDTIGKYELEFDWRANGMANYDLLRVFVVPATTSIEAGNYYGMEGASNGAPGGWIDAAGGLLQLQTTWQHQISEFEITKAGAYNLVFMWKNYRTGSNPPAAVDNISLRRQTCTAPTALTVSNVTGTDATLTWTKMGEADSWEIQYGAAGFVPGAGTQVFTNNTTHILTGLTGSTSYEAYVRAICEGENASLWSNMAIFKTVVGNTIPYSHNFEDEEENVNWVLLNGNQNSKWYINNVSDNASNETKVLYISSTGGATNEYNDSDNSFTYAMRTLRFPSAGIYEFEFDWKANGDASNDLLRAFLVPSSITLEAGNAYGMTTDRNEVPENWIALDGGPLQRQTTWQHLTGEVELANAGDYNLVFFWKNNAFMVYQKPAAIDNITIRQSTCLPPTALAITDISTKSAIITWEEVGTATTWEIQYAPEGVMPGQGTSVLVTNTPNYMLNDLLDATTYYVFVRAICGAGDTSRWSATAYFTTRCNGMITQIPYMENFDSYGAIPSNQYDVIPSCWSVLKSATIANYPYITNRGTSYMVSRPNALNFNAADEGYSMAILPELDAVVDITNLQISFSGRSDVANKQGTFYVGVMENPLLEETFTAAQSFTFVSATHTTYTVSLADYTGTGRYIAFKWEDAGMYNYSLDDVMVNYIEIVNPTDTCARPHSLAISNITKNSADITWTPGGDETSWEVAYKLFSEVIYTNTQTCTTPSLTLSDLLVGKGYDVRVRATCGDSKVSQSVVISFNTLFESFYTIIATAGDNGTISPSGSVTVVTGNDQTFTFSPNEKYLVKQVLVNDVSVGNASSYTFEKVTENATIHVEFELEEDTIAIAQHYHNNTVLVYPNPTQDNLKVRLSASFEQVEIINLLGQVIYTDKVNSEEFEVNVSHYHSGIYFIRLRGKEGVVTKRFIKGSSEK